MRYFSTRGGETSLTFEETVLTGLAPDGGLYIPERIPQLPQDWQSEWSTYSFQGLSEAVLSLYISPEEISRAELRQLVERSYASFRHADVTPVKRLNERSFILELFHGPTFAFKDVALQLLGNLFEFFLKRRNAKKVDGEPLENLTVVGATSGDTGSAAIYGLRNKENISIFILHPKNRISPIQEAQMTTVTDANVHNLAVKSTFDDCQDMVKALFGDTAFNAKHRLGAVNSINWARILAQTVYYFLAYFHVRKLLGDSAADSKIQFVVPTGNFGDVLAGYYAVHMGLPVAAQGGLAIATNENDILARFWASGRYEKSASIIQENGSAQTDPVVGSSDGKQAEPSSGVRATFSPAMDILVSSNFERLLWYLAFEAGSSKSKTEACKTVQGWMSSVKSDGRVTLATSVLELARKDFVARRVSDEETLETIKSHFSGARGEKYIADPHTAVGLSAARSLLPSNPSDVVQVILSTAHPAKFAEAVTRALQYDTAFNFARDVLPDELRKIMDLPRRVIDIERSDAELVKDAIERTLAAEGKDGGEKTKEVATSI